MTPAELHTAALAAIAERRALAAAGTPGPWVQNLGRLIGPNAEPQVMNPDKLRSHGLIRQVSDAALIVAAVNAFDRDTGALESVLERHAPVENARQPRPDMCRRCHTVYPCDDAEPALRALEVLP